MDKTTILWLLVFALIMIPTSILIFIYLIEYRSFSRILDSKAFVGIILTTSALFSLIMNIPLTNISKRILPKTRKNNYQPALLGDRVISFLCIMAGLTGVILNLLLIGNLYLGVETEPLVEIFF